MEENEIFTLSEIFNFTKVDEKFKTTKKII